MNQLGLHRQSMESHAVSAEVTVDYMSWWFWMKAGAGFALGAGAVYVLSQVLWLFIVIKNPALVWVRWLAKF